MTTHFRFKLVPGLSLAALTLVFSAKASAGPAKVDPHQAATTNAPAPEVVIPKASFDVTVKGIKDPFYPTTTRTPIPTENAAPPPITASAFELKGLSVMSGQRLALINNRTLAVGESTEVTTPRGKLFIRVMKIGDDSVSIRVDKQAELIELRLRKGF